MRTRTLASFLILCGSSAALTTTATTMAMPPQKMLLNEETLANEAELAKQEAETEVAEANAAAPIMDDWSDNRTADAEPAPVNSAEASNDAVPAG